MQREGWGSPQPQRSRAEGQRMPRSHGQGSGTRAGLAASRCRDAEDQLRGVGEGEASFLGELKAPGVALSWTSWRTGSLSGCRWPWASPASVLLSGLLLLRGLSKGAASLSPNRGCKHKPPRLSSAMKRI